MTVHECQVFGRIIKNEKINLSKYGIDEHALINSKNLTFEEVQVSLEQENLKIEGWKEHLKSCKYIITMCI